MHYKKSADNQQSPTPEIRAGDFVFVLAKFIRTTCPSKKLSKKYLGSFKVTSRVETHSYLVSLPDHLQAIYPVFHVSQLELALTSQIPNCTNSPPSSIEVDGNLEFEVTQVLDSKLDKHRKDLLLYYVHWASYEGTVEEFSWLIVSDLKNATELVANFYSHNPGKLGLCSTATTTPSYMADNA